MRSLEDLIDENDPAWPIVKDWIAGAKNKVELLEGDSKRNREVLTLVQVTTRSPMGALAYLSGGLVIDDWLRVLGGGGPKMKGDLARWNGLGEETMFDGIEGAFIVAIDAVGGVFAVVGATRMVSYFAPDSLRWEELSFGYSDFLHRMMHANLDEFFVGLRWEGWREDVAKMSLDEGMHILPPPFLKMAQPTPPQRRPVPMSELVGLGFEFQKQLS